MHFEVKRLLEGRHLLESSAYFNVDTEKTPALFRRNRYLVDICPKYSLAAYSDKKRELVSYKCFLALMPEIFVSF